MDVVSQNIANVDSTRGPDGKPALKQVRCDWRTTCHRWWCRSADNDGVATMQYLSLRKRNDDRVVHLEIAEFFTLRGGRILIHRSFFDSFDFLQQLLGQDLTGAYAHSVREAMR